MNRIKMSQLNLWRRLLLLGLLFFRTVPEAPAASPNSDEASGSYPGRVLGEIALHRQSVLQRVRLGYQTQAQSASSLAAVDIGNIAVLPDDGTLVTTANSFDLDQKNLLFQPVAGGFTVQAGAGGFDATAAAQGIVLNPQLIGDDSSLKLPLGFSFSYFGSDYSSVFINSDGNLTFGAGEAAQTARSLGRFLAGNSLFATEPFLVSEFHLYSSQLTSRGAFHVVEASYPLRIV